MKYCMTKNSVGYITLNRPEKYNTFNESFARLLNEFLNESEKDNEIDVVVIRSAGKHFSTGIDLVELNNKNWRGAQKFYKVNGFT